MIDVSRSLPVAMWPLWPFSLVLLMIILSHNLSLDNYFSFTVRNTFTFVRWRLSWSRVNIPCFSLPNIPFSTDAFLCRKRSIAHLLLKKRQSKRENLVMRHAAVWNLIINLPYVTIYATLSHVYNDSLANKRQLKMKNLTNVKVSRRLLRTVLLPS